MSRVAFRAPGGIAWRRTPVPVTAVPSVHEHVQQWACEQEQERKRAKEVSAVFGLKEECGDEEEAQRREDCSSER